MKRLYTFSIRSFIGPFIITLIISMFILILQFFWLYIDDLMGKGLGVFIISELLFYVSASLIPLAVPLAILLSSLMTFGNLSENNDTRKLENEKIFLMRKIEEVQQEIFQLENNIQFISSSSKGENPFIKEVQKNIERHKDDLKLWKEKLQQIKNM